ncbi:MAG TPA: TIR domain-containing protein [Opitutaceae bacterium]|nr:TIR domain-containing protein [Opitutaceae bacterium]
MSDSPTGAVFISYASQDAAAARKIREALRAAGVEVWFDENELVGGDAWDLKIRGQIKRCALFVPVISANTQARREGYFRIEWKLAAQRSHAIADGTPFVLPVVIDATRNMDALVPEEFRAVQCTRLPGGECPAAFGERVKELLRGDPVAIGSAAGAPLGPAPATDKRPRRRRLAPAVIGGVVVVTALAALLWRSSHHLESPGETVPALPPAPDRAPAVANEKSLAVLAFTNLSGDKENEYFSDGISEELGNVLARVPGLTVCGRASAFYFKGRAVPISDIARQLGVAYVVAGSVQRSGVRVRITAQLINAASGFTVWSSEPLTRELKDIFAVQDEIAGLIAKSLSLTMGVASGPAKTVDPEAYRLVLEGRYFWNLRTEEGLTRAEAAFGRAIAIEPRFAEAHAGLAGVCVIRAQYTFLDGLGGDPAADLERASAEALRATQLDPTLPDGFAALGYVYLMSGKMEESERQFQSALALAPNSALTRDWHGLLEASCGRLDGGLAEFEKAAEIDPLWFINLQMMAWLLRRSQRWEQALAMNERAAALRTDVFVINVSAQADALMALGRRDDAVAAARLVERNLDKRPRWNSDSVAIGVLVRAGLRREAEDDAARLFASWPRDNPMRGMVLGALGRFDEALPFLERTCGALKLDLYWDQVWDPWRGDPRFQELMVKLNCAEEYKVARTTLARMLKEQGSRNPAGGGN